MTQKMKQHQSILEPYMKHYGRTPEEQLKKNKPLMEKLRKWIEETKVEEITEEETKAREAHWQEVKQIIDSVRPEDHKLYS